MQLPNVDCSAPQWQNDIQLLFGIWKYGRHFALSGTKLSTWYRVSRNRMKNRLLPFYTQVTQSKIHRATIQYAVVTSSMNSFISFTRVKRESTNQTRQRSCDNLAVHNTQFHLGRPRELLTVCWTELWPPRYRRTRSNGCNPSLTINTKAFASALGELATITSIMSRTMLC